MSELYCPDCGATCQPQAHNCPDCNFPLELELHSLSDGLLVPMAQMDRWKRIAQLLKRGGLRVTTQKTTSTKWVWWLLPGFGAMLLMATMAFGPALVKLFWNPPTTRAAVLDLNNPDGRKGSTDQESDRESVAFLKDAFRTTSDQKQSLLTAEDLKSDKDRRFVTVDEVRTYFEQSYLNVRVKGKHWQGTLIKTDGSILVDSRLLDGAWVREIQETVNSGGGAKAVWVVPIASFPGGEDHDTSEGVVGSSVGLTLLRSDIKGSFSFNVNYYRSLISGEPVWVGKEVENRIYPELIKVFRVIPFNKDVNLFVLDEDPGSRYSGSPIFNRFGELIGVLLHYQGQACVLTLPYIRERAPLIFKEIH